MANDMHEIAVDDAIQIASSLATENKYDINLADVEVLKVKKGIERGPIRLVWLFQYFSKEEIETLLKKEFWIVCFYPKGLLENRNILGGGFCTLIELHSGTILFSFGG